MMIISAVQSRSFRRSLTAQYTTPAVSMLAQTEPRKAYVTSVECMADMVTCPDSGRNTLGRQ